MPSSLRVFREIDSFRAYRRQLLLDSRSVGLVPTMGALHAGHLSLITQAAVENSHVCVSIFVNPTQFGPLEDLESYPRTWEADLGMLRDLDQSYAESNKVGPPNKRLGRITAVFAPTVKTMYPNIPPSGEPNANGSFVTITPLASLLEGSSRPTFFRGVATVCMKLFNILTPDRVYFGQKDIQQTVIIKRMVQDFCIGSEVVVCKTIAEEDGLAMSSRNVYLGARRRKVAAVLPQTLRRTLEQYSAGERNRDKILKPALAHLDASLEQQRGLTPQARALFELDYLSLADPDTLEEMDSVDPRKGAIVSGAIRMLPLEDAQGGEDCGLGGGTKAVRLIDNIILEPLGLD
ncbi:MAG: pantothenate synthase [Trizodia sp. TS-e1964]|nr:MAG: pantothenate synthase [Trizodia sp. TS-e1964]